MIPQEIAAQEAAVDALRTTQNPVFTAEKACSELLVDESCWLLEIRCPGDPGLVGSHLEPTLKRCSQHLRVNVHGS